MQFQPISTSLRVFSKSLVVATVILIFAGSLVTSTGSGLAVPDWPLSYGMVFPPMVGGVFYEHGHRLIAATVGFLTLVMVVWLGMSAAVPRWIKRLGFAAIGLVIVQGLLGGLTVLLQLPPAVSVAHAVTGQTFFCLTIVAAYALSRERGERERFDARKDLRFASTVLALAGAVYVQLILGAVMRHLHAGLAVYDFPTMAGRWLPSLSADTLARINDWAMAHDQPLITEKHVIAHLAHRFWAFVVVALVVLSNVRLHSVAADEARIRRVLYVIDVVVSVQFCLGVLTVWSGKMPLVASLHVVTGAALLGCCTLLVLRAFPLGHFRRDAAGMSLDTAVVS